MTCKFLDKREWEEDEGREADVMVTRYPPHMIPGCHVTLHTSATNDREARLFLTALGIPVYGKHIN